MWQWRSLLQLPPRPNPPPFDTLLLGERVRLRLGDPADWRNWRTLREMSAGFLQPWEPSWPQGSLGYNYFCGILRKHWRDWRQDRAYNFQIFLHPALGASSQNGPRATGILIGGISLNNVQRNVAQKATVGYWLGEPYTGKGYMREACELVLEFAFDTMRLHRVEASCMPTNEASKHLLTRLGFAQEGMAEAYLQINDKWEDHLLWGKVRPSKVNDPHKML